MSGAEAIYNSRTDGLSTRVELCRFRLLKNRASSSSAVFIKAVVIIRERTFRSVLNGLSVLLLSLTLKLPENGTGIGIKKGIETVIIFPIHNSSFHEQVEEIAILNSWF